MGGAVRSAPVEFAGALDDSRVGDPEGCGTVVPPLEDSTPVPLCEGFVRALALTRAAKTIAPAPNQRIVCTATGNRLNRRHTS